MAADTSPSKQLEAPPLKPLPGVSKLAATPNRPPRYSVQIQNRAGQAVTVADPRATRALVALMDVHAVNGGAACHWGGPAAFADMLAALHALMFATAGRPWHEAFNFVNDAGHAENGIYALRSNYGFDGLSFADLKGFRSIDSKLTGHGESHLNPEGVLLSNGPLGSALPQAQGLALADKLAGRDRVTVAIVSDGASMEGEAKESFAAIPGLAGRGKLNPFVMVISDNDTKLSGRITKDAFSMAPTFASLEVLGWKVIKVSSGHDLTACYHAFEEAIETAARQPNQPVCLWFKTIKGYGVKSTEESSSGGHGFPLANGEKIIEFVSEIYGGQPPAELTEWARALRLEWEKKDEAKKAKAAASASAASAPAPVKTDKVQSGLAKGAIKAAQEGYPVFSVSSDVQGSTGISPFQKGFPDRFVEVGIAEANMISTGAGLSKGGYIPIVDTFGQFGVTKGNLPLTMAALSQAPVIAIFSHVGFQDAADGASHQATTYFAATCAIPHTVVVACSCADEAEALMLQAVRQIAEARKRGEAGESVLFFVGRENYPLWWVEGARYEWGKAQVLREGSDVVIAGCGTLLGKAIEAGRILAEKGVSATVVGVPFVNRVDVETLTPLVRQAQGRLITIEDHQRTGGMGSILSHALSQAGVRHEVRSLAIGGEFGQSAYLADQLYEKHGMSTGRLVETALAWCGRS